MRWLMRWLTDEVVDEMVITMIIITRRSPSRTEIFKSYKLSHKLTY